jgi:hypothetical protein
MLHWPVMSNNDLTPSVDEVPDELIDSDGWGMAGRALARAYAAADGWVAAPSHVAQRAPARPLAIRQDKTHLKPGTRFKQGDVTRATRAAQAAGMTINSVEIDLITGRIRITAAPASAAINNQPVDEFEEWKARRVAR